MPFQVDRQYGFLYLTLNTPGSAVNIFNHHAAAQVEQIMKSIDPRETRAVIFRSQKPLSFINGVGLMLANAVHTTEDAVKLTEGTRRAYEAVRQCPVPTIAAIQGNCYGCGVEFILNCDYRVAWDTFDTHFYMTEIDQYLFIPAFGGTQNLPGLVGLKKAIDLVLWGERWDVERAKRYGLIHEIFSHESFDERLDHFIRRVAGHKPGFPRKARPESLSEEKALVAEQAARIRQLPPAYQKVYRDCLVLMVRAARKERRLPKDYRAELEKSAESVMAQPSRSALSFFFIRQAAQGVCLRGEGAELVPTRWKLLFPAEAPELSQLKEDLARRNLKGVSVGEISSFSRSAQSATAATLEPTLDAATFSFRAPDVQVEPPPRGGLSETVTTALKLVTEKATSATDSIYLYSPVYPAGVQFFEVGLREKPTEGARSLFRYLGRAGFSYVFSNPKHGFALNRWLSAYLAPLTAFLLLEEGDASAVNATLRRFGFVRRPAGLLTKLKEESYASLAAIVRNALPVALRNVSEADIAFTFRELAKDEFKASRSGDDRVLDALTLSFLAEARRSLSDGTLCHPTLVDLIAREVLDFPLQHRSLCTYLKRDRIEQVLTRARRVRDILPQQTFLSAQDFLKEGRDFYL